MRCLLALGAAWGIRICCALLVEQTRLSQHKGSSTSALNVAPSLAHVRDAFAASRTSGLARPAFRVSGVLHAIAGTITHSGVCLPTDWIGTFRPCAVRTVFRTPTILTSKCGTASPVI